MNRPPLALVAVVGLLGLGTSVLSVGGSAPRNTRPTSVEVVGATAVCPDLRQRPGQLETRVSVGAAPVPAGRLATGGSMYSVPILRGGSTATLPVKEPGQVAVGLGTTLNNNGLIVTASRALAVGLEVEQVTRGQSLKDRGFAGLRCEPPKPEAWFLGGSTRLYDDAVLVLANVEDTPATVDVSVFSTAGPADARLGQGLTIQAHTRSIILLDTLAPDQSFLAVHIQSRRGRVAAALRYSRLADNVPLGVDWVPQTSPPSTTVVVPGFPKGPGFRWLMVANPGSDDTTVSVRVTAGDGQFVPTGMEEVSVPAQHTVMVPLTDQTATVPLAATVTSSGAPVLASGVVFDAQDPPIRELAFTAGAEPLSGPALLTDLVIDRPTESTLLFTAPDEAASVVITPIQVLGESAALPPPRRLQLPAGRTVAFLLSTLFPPATSRRLAVEVKVEPDSGPVYAARYLRARGAHGPLTTLLVLQGPAQLVNRPAVVQDPQAGYLP